MLFLKDILMEIMREEITKFFDRNFSKMPKKIAVAVSGGADSVALLFVLRDFCRVKNIELNALTVDHKMRKNSSQESKEIGEICRENRIYHEILEIDEEKLPQKNIEGRLRKIRYELFCEFCVRNKTEFLFLGHHKNDAAENFLIRLFRGSQIDGLAIMDEIVEFQNIKICRPFLAFHKHELIEFLREKKIGWFEDETNQDEKFLRNKIRNFFESFEEKDLIVERINKVSEVLKESKNFENEVLIEKAREILIFLENGSFLLDFEGYEKLKKSIYKKIALKILSLVLVEISGEIYKPRLEKLERFEKDLLNLEKGKKRDFYGCFAKILTKNNFVEIVDFVGEKEIRNNPEKYILIYSLNEKNSDKKFYFRTILKQIFEKNL